MNIGKEEIRENYKNFINKFHSYIEELKSSTIKDGLHILGEVVTGDRCATLIQALLRIDNCGMLAADRAVGKSLGYDTEELIDKPHILKDGKTNLMILEDIKNITTDIIKEIIYSNKNMSNEIFKDKYSNYKVIEKKYLKTKPHMK